MNLAPADLRKEGVTFDLPIALGLLAATAAIKRGRVEAFLVAGELALDGGIHAVRGVLPMALSAARAGLDGCLLPPASATEAALVDKLAVYPVSSLAETAAFLNDELVIAPARVDGEHLLDGAPGDEVDFADVRGQEHAKRCLEIAAAGGHHVLLLGPPGAGKTMPGRRAATTPRWARLTSPGTGGPLPPTSPASEMEWCGARNGRRATTRWPRWPRTCWTPCVSRWRMAAS